MLSIERRENLRFYIEGATLVFVCIVAVLTLIQTCAATKSADATMKNIAADWIVKMPVIVPGGISPKWEDLPGGGAQIDMTQNIVDSGDAAAKNLHFEWGWGEHPLRESEYQWRTNAWEGATITKSQVVFDSRKMSIADAKKMSALGVWYECGHITYEDQFPIAPALGHDTQHHEGKWCLQIKNFSVDKTNTRWDATVSCVDSMCDQ